MKRKIRFKLKTVINGEYSKTSSVFIEYYVDCTFNDITPVNMIFDVNSLPLGTFAINTITSC